MLQENSVPPFNILLDPLPEDYAGWLIRSDYRIGIQITLCLQDEELDQNERIFIALSLLFGNGIPPMETAVEGLMWFLRCGAEAREDLKTSGKQLLFFDFDHERIMSSFRKTYGMKLHREKLHWFEFQAMLDCLDDDSSLSNAIQVRGTDTSEMKGKQRANYERVKKNLTPPVHYTADEQAAIDEFWAQFDE